VDKPGVSTAAASTASNKTFTVSTSVAEVANSLAFAADTDDTTSTNDKLDWAAAAVDLYKLAFQTAATFQHRG
jgi:hypothetical protein